MKWRATILAVVSLTMLCACQIDPPLHLKRNVETSVELKMEMNADIMWQVDWKAEWVFAWDVSALGPLGYSQPTAMRMHVFPVGSDKKRHSHQVNNFYGTQSRVNVFTGVHDLLFHNIGSEVNLFRSADDLADIHAYTRIMSSGLQSSQPIQSEEQKQGGTKADELEVVEEEVAFAPDELFSLYEPSYLISDNLDDYELIDGHYVFRIQGELVPNTFIYLVQVILKNNDARIIGSMSGAAITGLAEGVDLMTGITHTKTVSVPFNVYMDKETDMFGARMLTFGIPGCNPYDPDSVESAHCKHSLVLNVNYSNGRYKNVRIDITDQIHDLPTGGVITITLDVDDFPPSSVDPPSPGSEGGGFEALIGDWEEQTGSTTIIN